MLFRSIDQEDSVIKAVYHGETSLETGIKLAVTNKLNELQYQLNRSAANLSQEQEKRLAQTVDFTEKIDESKENKKMVQTIAAAGLGFFLYMILITYASVTAQEVASEKGTKIMEVVFSSIRASHYPDTTPASSPFHRNAFQTRCNAEDHPYLSSPPELKYQHKIPQLP